MLVNLPHMIFWDFNSNLHAWSSREHWGTQPKYTKLEMHFWMVLVETLLNAWLYFQYKCMRSRAMSILYSKWKSQKATGPCYKVKPLGNSVTTTVGNFWISMINMSSSNVYRNALINTLVNTRGPVWTMIERRIFFVGNLFYTGSYTHAVQSRTSLSGNSPTVKEYSKPYHHLQFHTTTYLPQKVSDLITADAIRWQC